MAIMSSIMESIAARHPDAEFFVPTINPEWVRTHYGSRYRVTAVNVMPWTGSIRLLGIPTLRCFMQSDCALICDGIIFGKKLFNPAFNYLITLVFLVPLAALCGCRMVAYSCGIGPFESFISKLFAKWTLNGCDLVMMRERDSEALAKEIGVTKPIELTGDAAFINPVSSDETALQIELKLGINQELPVLAINATSYLDSWLKPEERLTSRESFIELLANAINTARTTTSQPFQPLIVCTQPMDLETCRQLARLTNGTVLDNSTYLSHDIQAVLRRCGMLIGMRFHSIVLASSVEIPVVGLVYAPKVRGYLRLLECEEFSLELASLTASGLASKIVAAWEDRRTLQERQRPIIKKLKAGAEHAADLLCERFFASAGATTTLSARRTNLAPATVEGGYPDGDGHIA
jgi:polysaccharide pyruvyl transferase WcaK-like protein